MHLPRQLRQRHNLHVEFLSERFEAGGDLGHLLYAPFHCSPSRALEQLDVIDHKEIQALLPLETPRPGGELRDRQPAGLVDEERQVLQLNRHILDLLEITFVDAAPPDRAGGNAALFCNDTCGQLLGGHFEREKADEAAMHGVDMSIRTHLPVPSTSDLA